jgi:L-amino acid N-acyltransferase YncA
VKIGHEGKGIGSALYGRLIAELKGSDVHALVAGITLPNEPSIILHEKMGFEKVAHFKETGYKFGEWRDVGYWELLLK